MSDGANWLDLPLQERDFAAIQRGLDRHPPEEAAAIREAWRDGVPAPSQSSPEEAAAIEAAILEDRPLVLLERLGPSYRVKAPEVGLEMIFRDVRTDGELSADVAIAVAERHLFRTTTTLSITARDKLAKTAAEFSGATWVPLRRAVFAAVEAVLSAEERLNGEVDLRTAPLGDLGSLFVAKPIWETGPTSLVGPGDSGKSSIARAVAVSLAGNLMVIPGIEPMTSGPILYVAGEDAVAIFHARSIEAICRGLGVTRSSLANPIVLFDSIGKPLHRIARAIAERAADFAGIILDPQSAFLAAGDQVRDRDNLFWRGVDTVERPTLIVAHPNLAQSRRWSEADGRIAGSGLNRDRVRLSWALRWRDELATAGSSFRRYTLQNTKRNHGETLAHLAFAAVWEFGHGDEDPGTVRFVASDPTETARPSQSLTPVQIQTLDAYRAGARTPAALASKLNLNINTAKSRLASIKGLSSGEG